MILESINSIQEAVQLIFSIVVHYFEIFYMKSHIEYDTILQ